MDWIIGSIFTAIFICMVMLFISLPYQAKQARLQKEHFMEECQKDKKEYECTAMWRSGDSQVVPVFIPMNTDR